jgi:PTH2 family peptidyl-tRNA hydrolase
MIKQVIVIRKDLNMRKGKMCSQSAHASMKVFFDRMPSAITHFEKGEPTLVTYNCHMTPEMAEWKDGLFTKICLSVDSEDELLNLYEKAQTLDLPCALIVDSGLTEFNGVPTRTCIAIGPAKAEVIDVITGHLKLL